MVISHNNYLYNPSVLKLNISQLFWYPTFVHCGYHYMPPNFFFLIKSSGWLDLLPHPLLYPPDLVAWATSTLPCAPSPAPSSFHWFNGVYHPLLRPVTHYFLCWTPCLFISSLISAKLLKFLSPPWILFKTLDGANNRKISNSSPLLWFSPPEHPGPMASHPLQHPIPNTRKKSIGLHTPVLEGAGTHKLGLGFCY